MADNNLVSKITDIIIQQTVNQKIPTLVILSGINKGDLVKNIIQTLKGGNSDENTFSSDEWEVVAEIMQRLAEIPLLLKESTDINVIQTETEEFIINLGKTEGLIIICCNKDTITRTQFTKKENISIIVL